MPLYEVHRAGRRVLALEAQDRPQATQQARRRLGRAWTGQETVTRAPTLPGVAQDDITPREAQLELFGEE